MGKKNSGNEEPIAFTIIGSIVAISGMIYIATFKPDIKEFRKLILTDASAMTFNGRVDSVYREEQNHNEQVVRLANVYLYRIWADWEDKIEVGDSLAKKKKDLKVFVFKRSGKTDTLDYRELVKGFH